MITIDQLCYQSKLRYVNASEKFWYAIITLLLCVGSRSLSLAFVVLMVNAYLIVKKSGVAWKRYGYFLAIPMTFMILSTIAIVVNFVKDPVGGYHIVISEESIYFAIQLVITALASVTCLYFLSFTTPMPDILNVLRQLHCPNMIIELMMLIYRYIFVLLETASSMTRSQQARLGNRDYKTSLKSFGALGSTLFIRAMKRSNSLYDAMEARVYDGVIRVLQEDYPPKKKEIIGIVLAQICYVGIILVEQQYLERIG